MAGIKLLAFATLASDLERYRGFYSCSNAILFLDAYGHDAGDSVLISIAGVINNHMRSSDVIARSGGEEIRVPASLGITTVNDLEEPLDLLLKRADEVLYKVKEEGRNCCRYSIGK